MDIQVNPKTYIHWNSNFGDFVSLKRMTYGPKEALTPEDLKPLYAYSFHRLIGSQPTLDSDENIRLANQFIPVIVDIANGGPEMYHSYAGENALEERKSDLHHVLTILGHLGIIEFSEELYLSKLKVPVNRASGSFFQELNTEEDVKQYLLSLCRFFNNHINPEVL